MRREWIEEEKPQQQVDDDGNNSILAMPESSKNREPYSSGDDPRPGFSSQPTFNATQQGSEDHTEDQPPRARTDLEQELFIPSSNDAPHVPDQDAPDDDELEALLNEQDS